MRGLGSSLGPTLLLGFKTVPGVVRAKKIPMHSGNAL